MHKISREARATLREEYATIRHQGRKTHAVDINAYTGSSTHPLDISKRVETQVSKRVNEQEREEKRKGNNVREGEREGGAREGVTWSKENRRE